MSEFNCVSSILMDKLSDFANRRTIFTMLDQMQNVTLDVIGKVTILVQEIYMLNLIFIRDVGIYI